ncbi:MAG: PQQ-binding-like beta-propeller repeat protein [Planctomycetaceae bacterium]|nr:PQQ-binding-like beta-propeller repeat protein [Planctomycetaceae bacterium]
MTTLTVVYLILVVISQVFISAIEDAAGIGLDMVMGLTIFATAGLLLLWAAWILLLSRWKIWKRLVGCVAIVLLPFAFLTIFRPIHGGDVNVMRFEPIWARRPPLESIANPGIDSVDLTVEGEDDFPQFLGPNRNGVIPTNRRLDTEDFENGCRIVWKQPIGLGWSGFVVRNGYALTMEQRGDDECVTCYDVETGKLQWSHAYPARHRDQMNLGRIGPRSTPTIHQGRVYAVGAVGHLVCLNGTDGSVVWQHDLNELLKIRLDSTTDHVGLSVQYEGNTKLAWGRSGSPLIVDDMVIVPGGGPDGESRATLLAFDVATGELRWKNGSHMIAYGSPVLADLAGHRQIVMTCESVVAGFDSKTGQELWSFPRPGKSDGDANTSQVTILSDSDVLTSKGYFDGGGQRIHLEEKDGRVIPSLVWDNPQVLKTKLTSPVIFGDYAYSLSNGFMECARLSGGERIWKRRGRFGHGQYVLVGQTILLHSESGELHAIEATPDEYRELGTFRTIEGVCWNPVCLSGRRLLVRSEIEAACIELPMTE